MNDSDVSRDLQSTIHVDWAWKYGSHFEDTAALHTTMHSRRSLFPSTKPHLVRTWQSIGETYHEHRLQLMLARQEGLTATYNRFHNPDERAADIARLRELHVEMDRAVAAAYGWDDLDLGHGFHETAQGVRFTIDEAARREVLGRLLELNHQRYAEEVAAGLHEKRTATTPRSEKTQVAKKRRGEKVSDHGQMQLFE